MIPIIDIEPAETLITQTEGAISPAIEIAGLRVVTEPAAETFNLTSALMAKRI